MIRKQSLARSYTVVYERDAESGQICATFPALDLATHGRTLREARTRGRAALELHLEGLAVEDMAIPEDVVKVETLSVAVSALRRTRS